MPYEFIPVLFFLTLVFGILVFVLIKKFLDDRNRMQLREMAHQERLKALEQEVPLVEVDPETAFRLNGDTRSPERKSLIWLRLSALCLGLASTFGGIGLIVAFLLISDPDAHEVWPVGFIPVMIGVGLLLFYVLSRFSVESLDNEQPKD